MDGRYGAGEVRIRRLEDAAGLMRAAERVRVEQSMEEFERRFPQLFFAVHTGRPEGRSDVRQFGFWLLNRAAFVDVPLEKPNEWGILLTIDPDAKSAGMTWGYGLDAYLSEKDSFEVLSHAHAHWLEGRYADGIVRGLACLASILATRSRQARRDPERFERRVAPPAPALGAPIRAGHRKTKSEEVVK